MGEEGDGGEGAERGRLPSPATGEWGGVLAMDGESAGRGAGATSNTVFYGSIFPLVRGTWHRAQENKE